MASGGVASQDDARRINAESFGVFLQIAECGGDIVELGWEAMAPGCQAIVRRRADVAEGGAGFGHVLQTVAAAAGPSAAVNPEDERTGSIEIDRAGDVQQDGLVVASREFDVAFDARFVIAHGGALTGDECERDE